MRHKGWGIIFVLMNFFILINFLFFNNSVYAKVIGPCSNCHTMHNSQNSKSVTSDNSTYNALTKGNCLGCHTGINNGNNTIPYVYSTTEPTFGNDTLAGGNFYWVKKDDTKGHNVFPDNPDDFLSKAPGALIESCGTNCCHNNLSGVVSNAGYDSLNGRQGCTKCHMVNGQTGPIGYHHAQNPAATGSGWRYINSFPWYRFLSGHITGEGHGVVGIEDAKWNYHATSDSHNEYAGKADTDGGWGFSNLGNTMTAYCTGCHGLFHDEQGGGSPWIRHPSDAVIPDKGEYRYAFGANGTAYPGTYDPKVPVARPIDTFNWQNGPKNTVTIGQDLVMCLSCHVAHGSPYDDLLRWDYSKCQAGSDNPDPDCGCFKCHTQK